MLHQSNKSCSVPDVIPSFCPFPGLRLFPRPAVCPPSSQTVLQPLCFCLPSNTWKLQQERQCSRSMGAGSRRLMFVDKYPFPLRFLRLSSCLSEIKLQRANERPSGQVITSCFLKAPYSPVETDPDVLCNCFWLLSPLTYRSLSQTLTSRCCCQLFPIKKKKKETAHHRLSRNQLLQSWSISQLF